MRSILGFAMFFIALGMLISYFVEGFFEFILIVVLFIGAYCTLCKW